jgi:putative MATE family efflux protein
MQGVDSGALVSSVVMIDQIKNLFTAIGGGLATGATIVVSRLIGKNDYQKAKTVANTLIIIAFVTAVALVLLLLPFADLILRLGGMTENLIAIGREYFIVQIVTVGVNIFNSVFLGMEKSRGATQNILYINLAVMAVKITLTVLFVYVFKQGATMVAVSTLIANLCVTAYAVVMMMRRRYLFAFDIKNTNFHKSLLRPYISLSTPVFLGKFVFSMGKVIVNANATHYGENAAGALGISNHISGSVTSVCNSIEESASTVISQNIGAGKYERVRSAFYWSLGISLFISAIGVILLSVFQEPIIALFSKDKPAEYAQLVASIFNYEKVGIMFLGISSAAMGMVYGFGYTKMAMILNLSRLFVLRVPVIYIMVYGFPNIGAEALGIAMMVSNVGIGLMCLGVSFYCLSKIKKNTVKDVVNI